MSQPAGVGDAMRLYGLRPPDVISTNNTGAPMSAGAERVATGELVARASAAMTFTDPVTARLLRALADRLAEQHEALMDVYGCPDLNCGACFGQVERVLLAEALGEGA
jgi:hypothetical protein